MPKSLNPALPVEGQKFTIFGIRGTVEAVTPQDDWSWKIDLAVVDGAGNDVYIHVFVPTDFRTDDKTPAYAL